jgi:hypothetical protein
MKKRVFVFVSFLLILSVGAFAQNIEGVGDGVADDVRNYVESFLDKGGIEGEQIEAVTEVNQADLPDEIEIKEIEENNVGIYEVNFTEGEEEKNIFVVTYSTPNLEVKEEVKTTSVQYLSFGSSEILSDNSYLESVNGVKTGKDVGYVMMRPGSVTGISTSLNVEGSGSVEIKVYKNGVDTGFSNLIVSEGSSSDFDIQSEDVVKFNAGDSIAVYVKVKGSVEWSDVVTLVEVMN